MQNRRWLSVTAMLLFVVTSMFGQSATTGSLSGTVTADGAGIPGVTVTATSPTVLFAMFGADFAKLVGDTPELHDRIEAALDERLPAD